MQLSRRVIFISVLCLSLAVNGLTTFIFVKTADLNRQQEERYEEKLRILNFVSLFTETVLLAENEIDFETRLKLETSVRNLGNEQILEQWQKFVNSQDKDDAKRQAKQLVHLFANMSY